MAKDVDPDAGEAYSRQIVGHLPHAAQSPGELDAGETKTETPTKPLPSISGDQQVERVTVGGEPSAEVEPEE